MLTTKRAPLENFEAQFKKSTFPMMVLKSFQKKKRCTLSKLQAQGFVTEIEKVISDANKVRIYYSVTEDGKAYLEELKQLYEELTKTVMTRV